MTGQPFLTALLGDDAAIVVEAAFGADLTDTDGTGWVWTDLGSDPQHDPGIPITVGRSDNVGQAGAAAMTVKLLNAAGDYTPGNPSAAHVVTQNTPIRERMTLDGVTWFTRFQGYLDSANPVTNQRANVKWTSIAAFGALGRLGGLKKPLKSPLYRAYTTLPNVVAYWPLEDAGSSNNLLPSPLAGVAPLTLTNATYAADAGIPGSAALPQFSATSSLSATIPPGSLSTFFQIDWYAKQPTPPAAETTLLEVAATGTVVRWVISATATDINMRGFDATGTQLTSTTNSLASITAIDLYDDNWKHFRFIARVDAGDLGYEIDIFPVAGGPKFIAGTVLVGGTYGPATSILVPVQPGHDGMTFGHPSVQDAFENTDLDAAAGGWVGETADDRLTRLCAEENIFLDMHGTSTVTMGPQSIDTILNLLRECEAADHGVLYDGFGPGVGYQCRSDRYNADPVLTVDMGADPPQVTTIAPVFDKQAVKNLYTVTRKNGAAASFEQTRGPLGTDTIGVEDATATVNIADDNDVPDHASWLVSLGTVAGFRYPGIGLTLRGIPSLAADVLAVAVGDRITIQNPASKATDLPPDDIDLIVEGWTETTTADTWTLTLNTSPYQPYRVFVLDDDTLGRIDTGGSVLAAPVTSSATALPVLTTKGPLWTEDSDDMPFDVNVGGERCTVTDIAASTTPGTRVGARLDTTGYGGGHWNADAAVWNTITGITLPVTRWYQAGADFTIGTDLTQIIGAGVKVCLSLRPDATPNPTHLASIDTMLSTMKGDGAAANIALWHEPFFGGLTAAQFQTVIRYYGPTVRKYFPLWLVLSGDDTDPTNGYYPPAAYYDGVAVDNYVASPVGNLTDAQTVADEAGKPLGIWEFNGAADLGSPAPPVGQTQATVTTRFTLIQDLFADRLTAGKPNGDLILFSAQGGTTGTRNFLGHAFTANGGFEGSVGNWVNGSGVIAQTAAQAHSGTKSAQITSPAGGGTSNILMCQTPSITTQGLPCVAGQSVMGYGWFRAAVTARLCRIDIHWYNAAGTALSVTTGTTITDNTTGWTSAQTSGTAPASTAFARLEPAIQSTAASEVHYFDDPQIAVLPTNPLTSAIQYPWDYRIALLADMVTALDSTSFGQEMTVTRSVNGAVTAHNAGEAVSLWNPAVLAL